MNNSRLERVRSRKAGKQGVYYMIMAAGLILVTILWGLPAIARLTDLLIKSDTTVSMTDELRPTPPIFSDIPEATYSAKVKIAGFAQPGLDVILYVNGAEQDRKLVSESGTFNFEDVPLAEGENATYGYTATSRDLRSEQSKTYTVTLDSKKPAVTLTSPSDGQVFRGQSQRITNIVGSVDDLGSKVYVGERMVIVSSDGKFDLTYQLVEGDQELQIKGIDKAGNESVSTIKLRWEP